MASEWNEAAARQRLADYTDALDQVGNELKATGTTNGTAVSETRARLEAWCWHDLRHAYAEIDRLAGKCRDYECREREYYFGFGQLIELLESEAGMAADTVAGGEFSRINAHFTQATDAHRR